MSEFANEVLSRGLAELRGRRAKLEVLIGEARELDTAIKEMERVCRKIGAATNARPKAVETAPAAQPARPPKEGTNAERALKALKEHPRGLNTAVIARQCDIPSGSISVVLSDMADKGLVTKVGRGFWRAADVDADAA